MRNALVVCGSVAILGSVGAEGFTLPCPLFLCRTQAEMAHTCRGTINLSTAHIDTEDSCNIVLSNGGRTYHLKANSEVERQRWVTALELAKAKAIRMRNNQSGRARLGVQTCSWILLKNLPVKQPFWAC